MSSPPGHNVFLQLRDAAAATTTTSSANSTSNSTEDIGKYATDLNGVDQSMNNLFKNILWWSLGVLALAILIMRMWERANKHYRHLFGMTVPAEHQGYWARNSSSYWKIKKYILYAPLWNKRHNREIKLTSAVNIGTIPSRVHTILLTLYVLSNLAYCAALDYGVLDHYAVVAELRGRTGVLAVCNLIALVIFAGRNNPLIQLLQISFDTYNLLHRWMGRIVVIESIAHTIAWAYVKHAATGWSGIASMMAHDPFIFWGTVATCAMTFILIQSPGFVRHAAYETFLNIHIILAFASLLGIYLHLKVSNLPQVPYIIAVILLWTAERLARIARLVYHNYPRNGYDWTNATIKSLPGEASRVTLHLPKYVDIKPGTHAYLRFKGLNVWESHPFSIAWVVHNIPAGTLNTKSRTEKELESQPEIERMDKSKATTDISFVIHAQTGLTRRLFSKASEVNPRGLTLKAAFEGPYGGHHSLDSYGTAVLFAGSSGITHQIPYVKHLLNAYPQGLVVTRRIVLVWIIRDSEHLEWVRPWMDEILKLPNRRDILNIKLYITRPKNPREIASPSATVQMSPGRPNIKHLLLAEVRDQVGAMCVTVCGPGGLADNVREAVREVQEDGVVDFIEESFTW